MSSGATVVAVAVEEVPLAAVALRDKLAPFARTCVAQLELSNVQARRGGMALGWLGRVMKRCPKYPVRWLEALCFCWAPL